MKKSKARFLTSALLIALIVPHAYSFGVRKTVSCEEAVKNSAKVKAGMKESEVLELLGSPKTTTAHRWSYSFVDCVKFPPAAGETAITGLDIFFSDGVVKEVRRSWVDATGMRAPAKPDEQKNKKQTP